MQRTHVLLNIIYIQADPPPKGGGFTDPLSGTLKLYSGPGNDKRAIVDPHPVQYKQGFPFNDGTPRGRGNSASQ